MPPFLAPLALIGLATLPALAAIYWLRNRYRRQTVSSLMLWADLRQAREGGTRVHRLQTPLLFALELLALAMLVIAAAGPRLLASGALPLMVVLDDSYSMQAGDPNSPRAKAIEAIIDELRSGNYSVQFIVAGREPQRLGERVQRPAEAEALLEQWRCYAPASDLRRALGAASELGGRAARILVLTDQPPPAPLETDRVEWRAFGRSQANLAFVGAARSDEPGRERCLFEIANLSDAAITAPLIVEQMNEESGDAVIHESTVSVDAGGTTTLFIDLTGGAAAIRARLGDDPLAIDNQVILLPPASRPVAVAMSVSDQTLAKAVQQALAAIDNAHLTSSANAALRITDRAATAAGQTWTLRLMIDEDAQPYVGPFVIDLAHPLTEGLSLDGVIWAASAEQDLPGRPILAAGNVTLISDTVAADGRHDVRMRIDPARSTLHRSPNWPILMWNLIQWRAADAPGPLHNHVRLGDDAIINVDRSIRSVRITDPRNRTVEQTIGATQLRVPATRPGVWRVDAGEASFEFVANVLYRDESDLRATRSGSWGQWSAEQELAWSYRDVAWVCGLIAAALLAAHMMLVSRAAGKGGPRV